MFKTMNTSNLWPGFEYINIENVANMIQTWENIKKPFYINSKWKNRSWPPCFSVFVQQFAQRVCMIQSPRDFHALFALKFVIVAQRPDSDSKISDDRGDDIGLIN